LSFKNNIYALDGTFNESVKKKNMLELNSCAHKSET